MMARPAAGKQGHHVAGQRLERRAPLRLLFLVPFAPRLDAAHGGARAIAQLIMEMAQRHRIALCYLRGGDEPGVCDQLQAACEVVEEVRLPDEDEAGRQAWRKRLHVWGQVIAGKPLWGIGRSSGAYKQRVRALLDSWQPDMVQIEYHIMGQYLPALEGHSAARLLVQHEPGYDAAQESLRVHRGRLMPYLNWLAWQRFDRWVIRRVQAVVVFTERDRRTVAGLGLPTRLVRIPLGARLPHNPLDPAGSEPLSLIFAGNFLHGPNVEAALRLADEIFPRVVARFPGARLYIVGSDPPAALLRRASDNVMVTGYVQDVTPYLDRAALVVVPLSLGGGMRVKVLEALAFGKAVVATRLATEGLALTNGEHVALAETDAEFETAITELLLSSQQRAAMAAAARAWACANLRWDAVADEYEALYRDLVRAP